MIQPIRSNYSSGVSTPAYLPEINDQNVSSVGEAKKSGRSIRKGVADYNDSFELASHVNNLTQNAQQNRDHAHKPENTEINNGKVGSAGQNVVSGGVSFPYRRKEHIDGDGYKWVSFEFMPPNAGESQAIDPYDPKNRMLIDKMDDLSKSINAQRMSEIRA